MSKEIETVSEGIPVEQEAPAAVASGRRRITIGLPACCDTAEKRFPLTPEAAGMLVERGFVIKIEKGAAGVIHYSDAAYERCGVEAVSRRESLGCDIVIHLAPLQPADIRAMRRGSMLLTLLHASRRSVAEVKALLDRHIISIALDLVEDSHGNRPFADILAEIDGLAAVAIASSLLADAVHGKGILLGGVAGVVPCETTVIGSGIAACSAARSASGFGSVVRIFDNDIYSLREATRDLGPRAVGSVLHPRTLEAALRTADIIIYAGTADPFAIDAEMAAVMKKGVIAFDLTCDYGHAFPSLPCFDLASASASTSSGRCCYVNAGSAVPRTAAMALSNTLLTMLGDIVTCDGVVNALKLQPGLQRAACTFMGRPVNSSVASVAGMRATDINIYLALS